MRFFGIASLAALAASAVASPQEHYGHDTGQVTSAVTTYYSTMTVFRVETTVTATRNGSVSTYASTSTEVAYPTVASAGGSIPAHNNTAILGTGAQPSASGVEPSLGAGSSLSIGSMAAAAVAGLVGICLL